MIELRDIGRAVVYDGKPVGQWSRADRDTYKATGDDLPDVAAPDLRALLHALREQWAPVLGHV